MISSVSLHWLQTRRTQLRLAVRMSVACVLTYGLCLLLGLKQTYPAVLTAVIVMQASVGGSLKAMLDRFLGTSVGAVWSIAILVAFHWSGMRAPGVEMTAAVIPLSFLAALRPAYRVAPVTAIILILTPDSAVEPLVPAVERVFGIALGSLVAFAISLLVLPSRAHESVTDAAGKAINSMADLVAILMNGLLGEADPAAIQSLHDQIRAALSQTEAAADETTRERSSWLSNAPDPQPLCRTLRRLRNDLALLGRAAAEPLPVAAHDILAPPSMQAAVAVAAFLHEGAAGSLAPVDAALSGVSAALTELRASGVARQLPDESVERIFGLAFAFEQIGQNVRDLADRVREISAPAGQR